MSLATSNGSEITTNDPPDLTSTENRPSSPTSDHASTQAPTNNSTGSVTIPCIGSDNVKLLRIPVRFKGIDTLALVDTGSVASLLAERVYREISDICITVKPTFKSFVSAGGHPIETCGCFKIVISLPGFQTSQQFYVIKNLQEDCILGLDFLSQHETCFSSSRKLLTIGRNKHRIRLSTNRPYTAATGYVYHVATDDSGPSLPPHEDTEDPASHIESILNDFQDRFAASNADLGRCTLVLHHIETTGPPTY